MTTETPSVDEALCGAVSSTVMGSTCLLPTGHGGSYHKDWNEATGGSISWPVVDVFADAAFGRAVNRLKAEGTRLRDVTEYGWFDAGRAEAIRERDEAIALLRLVEWNGGLTEARCISCGNLADLAHDRDCDLSAFLSRFPEGGER